MSGMGVAYDYQMEMTHGHGCNQILYQSSAPQRDFETSWNRAILLRRIDERTLFKNFTVRWDTSPQGGKS